MGEPQPHLRPYLEAIGRHGPTFEALLWTSPATQQVRFTIIAEIIDLSRRRVLDAGCGRADLLPFLRQRGVEPESYIGMEAIPALAEAARSRGLPGATIVQADLLADEGALARVDPPPEVILFSGSLNTMRLREARLALSRAWAACTHALVFNFLCHHHARGTLVSRSGPAKRFATRAMLAWALERTPTVRLRSDYLGGKDATIAMLKQS